MTPAAASPEATHSLRAEASAERADSFAHCLKRHALDLKPLALRTLQVNLGDLCNQACAHCHVDASPAGKKSLDRPTAERCLELLAAVPTLEALDLTGGAPELNPNFEWMVEEARGLGKTVMVRHNLTVTWDPHPATGRSMERLPDFFAHHRVEVISSLPYYDRYFTDKQRGSGVFEKSLRSLRALNERGYGREGSGLALNLVYNPVGAFLPAPQASLEADFKRELERRHGVVFNRLYTITNMPIRRFGEFLKRTGQYDEYMAKLRDSFNPSAAEGVMCRSLLSVGWDGRIYDCDFNQMIGLEASGSPTVWTLDPSRIQERGIRFANHCFGCAAGSGSSCGGATA